jgi:hypothetical protein
MKYLHLLLLTLLITVFSCKKEVIEQEELTAKNQFESDVISDETQNIADAANWGDVNLRTDGTDQILSGCATVTKDTLGANQYQIIVDFGSTNCQCSDGRTRRGKIIININGKYFTTGSTKTITFSDYYRNDNLIDGTKIITNGGPDFSGKNYWRVQCNNMKITRPDGSYHTWTSTRVRTLLKGQNTASILDDEYQITGFALGSSSNGVSFTAIINTPLHRRMSCKWIDTGVIEFKNSKGQTRSINYGYLSCDADAVIEITGKRGRTITKTITLN